MEKYTYNEQNGLWYELQGDYYLPCLKLPEEPEDNVEIEGRMVQLKQRALDILQMLPQKHHLSAMRHTSRLPHRPRH